MRNRSVVLVFMTFSIFLQGCASSSTSVNFPEFQEVVIAGPGDYGLPQWSPNGKYLAFTKDEEIIVYDLNSEEQRSVADDVRTNFYDWSPSGDITYLKYRPSTGSGPVRLESDLRSVGPDGKNDTLIASDLIGARDFAWFQDMTKLLVVQNEPDTQIDYKYNDTLYILDVKSGTNTLLTTAAQLDLDLLTMIDLSSDEKSLLIYGVRIVAPSNQGLLLVYGMVDQKIVREIVVDDTIPGGTIDLPSAVGDFPNFGWVGGDRWVLAAANTPGGNCYNYALFFFDTKNPDASFCIPSADQIVAAPVISPDKSQLAYIAVGGVGQYYVVVADLTPDMVSQIGSQ